MSFPEGSGLSAVVGPSRPTTDPRLPLGLAQLWLQDGPTPSEEPRRFIADTNMPTLELPRLELVWPTRPQVDRPVITVSISAVLSAWRAAERELGAVPAGSPERSAIHEKVVGLRATYHRLFDERCDRGHSEDESRTTDLLGYVTGLDLLRLVSR